MAVTRSWRVYGRNGHRQRVTFGESVYWDWSDKSCGTRIFEAENFDKTGTHEYTIVRITRDTAEQCYDEFEGQLTDGYFENSAVGKIIEIE